MEALLNLGSRRLIKVGGSLCIPLPPFYLKNVSAGKGAEFDIELLEDRSIRIKPN